MPANVAPRILNRPYSINAEVTVPEGGAEGVLLSMGGNDGGISFYVKDGKLCFVHNYVGMQRFTVMSDKPITAGRHILSMEFQPTGKPDIANGKGAPGAVKLLLDGKAIGRGDIPVTAPLRLGQGAAMLVGGDVGGTVTPDYKAPFHFSGTLKRVIVDISGEHVEDYEAQIKIALAKQ